MERIQAAIQKAKERRGDIEPDGSLPATPPPRLRPDAGPSAADPAEPRAAPPHGGTRPRPGLGRAYPFDPDPG